MRNLTKFIVKSGLIAGLYVALSLVTFPIASGAIQFRVSEALTILPLIMIEAVPGLFVGCILSNMLTGCVIIDVAFGSIITLLASALTYLMGRIFKSNGLKIFTGGLFPVLLNAFFLPLIWLWCYGALEYMYVLQVAFLLVSQGLAVYGIGSPLYFVMKKLYEKGLVKN